jgi:hypothetical protein
MKTKLLKLALCAMAALPIGAWADSEVWSINYAKLATDNVTYGESPAITANKSTTEKVTINSNTLTTYAFSQSTYLAENNVWVNRDNLLLRFKDINTIGLYHASQTCFNIKNVQEGDVIEIAYKGTDIGENDVYNATVSTTTSTYIHHYAYGDNNDRTFVYDKVYTLTAGNESTNVGFMLQGGYFLGKITVTRPSNTACSVSTQTGTAAGNNANTALPTGSGEFTTSATWGGSNYVFTLSSASECIRNYNNGNAHRKVGNNIAIQLTNNTINISHSPNIKSIKLYALTNATSGNQATITADGTTELGSAPLLGSEAVDPEEFDITNYSSIKASSQVLVAFDIEYYASATLTVADINWASMYLPFAVNIPNEVTGVYYATAASSSSNVITLKKREADLPKETGVLVNAPAGTYTFTAATEAPDALASTNLFLGSATDKPLDDEEAYVLAGSTNTKATPVFKLYSSGEGTIDLSAYKAYLPASSVESSARILNFVFEDDETTGLTEMKSNNNVKNSEAYNLVGQRVSTNTKGIVIINGRKYINK